MKTVRDVLLAFDMELNSIYEPNEVNAIKYLALEQVTLLSKSLLRAFDDKKLSDDELKRLFKVLNLLKTGEPIQYIFGYTEFYGLRFNVTPAVLIPRPETEELVKWIIDTIGNAGNNQTILDIGTGSGCIPVTLKKYLPQANLSAIDVSIQALEIARQNALLNNVIVGFFEADILNVSDTKFATTYNAIVSNPPYVTEKEKSQMHNNVLKHEPHLALFVLDDDPLLFYREIADFASHYLEIAGYLFFEINENLGNQVVALLKNKGFKNIELRKDMNEKDRMVKAMR